MNEQLTIQRGKGSVFPWTTLLVVLNLIAIAIISQTHFTRWDLTETNMYTLSGDTVDVLRKLDDTVTVKVFISDELPMGTVEFRRRTEDLLEEFKLAAGDKLNLIYINPSASNPDLITEAKGYGITPVPVSSMSVDRSERMDIYLGIALLYEGRFETIPFMGDSSNLEYDLLMKISRVIRPVPVTVAFFELPDLQESIADEVKAEMKNRRRRNNRHTIASDYSWLAEYLKDLYDVTTVDLMRPVPAEVSTLVLTNTHLLNEVAFYFVDQFLMRGGKLIVLKSGIEVDKVNYAVRPDKGKLDEWLGHYGIEITKNVVLDKNCLVYPFTVKSQTSGRFFQKEIAYPCYLQVLSRFYNLKHPVTASLNSDMNMYFTSGLELNPPEGCKATTLIRSSVRAWEQREVFEIHPEAIRSTDPGRGSYNQFVLSGLVEGTFSSYFTLRSLTDEGMKDVTQGKKKLHFSVNGKPTKTRIAPSPGEEPENEGTDPSPPSDANGGGQDGADATSTEQDVPGGGIQEQEVESMAGAGENQQPGDQTDLPAEALIEEASDEASGLVHPDDIVLQSPETAILVIANEDFGTNPPYYGLPRETQNAVLSGYWSSVYFFCNAVDYLSVGGGFSTIRTREVLPRRIDLEYLEEPGTAKFIQWVGTLSGSIAAIILAAVLHIVRKSTRRKETVL